MSFYKSKRKANQEIDEIIKKEILLNRKSINLSKLTLEITSKYEVSEKAVKERIALWTDAQSEFLEVIGKELRFKKENQ